MAKTGLQDIGEEMGGSVMGEAVLRVSEGQRQIEAEVNGSNGVPAVSSGN